MNSKKILLLEDNPSDIILTQLYWLVLNERPSAK
jgi:hypothetical protein